MKGLGAAQWSELSALYDEASALSKEACEALLARLAKQHNPIAEPLRGMLEAARHVQTSDFLEASPMRGSLLLSTVTGPAGPPPSSDGSNITGLASRESDAADASAEALWLPDQTIGPYRLEALLGAGGMAEVWLARHHDGRFDRPVALKLPHLPAHAMRPGSASRAAWARRFDRERDILATLRHPHIAGLLDAGVTPDGQAWLALEYVAGEALDHYCDSRQLPIGDRVRLFRQVLLAIQHAHSHLVIHRDLKPANILVTPDGEVRLLDFGIAKLLEADTLPAAATELTRHAGHYMTPAYASPEQLQGKPLGTRSDIYALGIVLYELLCGLRPYELKRETAAALERAILDAEPRPPSRRDPIEAMVLARAPNAKAWRRALAPELDAVALRALAKQPEARYSSVDALLADIDRWLAGEPVLARAPSLALRTRKFALRHRLGVGVGAAVVAGMVGLTTVAVVQGQRAKEESARAVAAKDFLLDMFRRADPNESKGADVTARDMLAWGREQATTGLGNQPVLQADLLQGIGSVQVFTGDYESADRTLAVLEKTYRRLNRAPELIQTLADRAEVAVRLGDYSRSGIYLTEAERVMPKPPPPDLTARVTAMRGLQASFTGETQRALHYYDRAIGQARAAWGSKDSRTIDILRYAAEAHSAALSYKQALLLLDEAVALSVDTTGIRSEDIAGMAWERASVQFDAGLYGAVAEELPAAYAQCVKMLGDRHEQCGLMQRYRALAHLRIGQVAQAQELLPDITARSAETGSPKRQAEALIVACRILAHSGRVSEPTALWNQLETIANGHANGAAADAFVEAAAETRAEAWLLIDRPNEALPWIELALTRVNLHDAPDLGERAYVGVLMGKSLALQEQWSDALRWLQDAQQDAANAFGPQHPLTLLFSMNQLAPLHALKRHDEAASLIKRAEPILSAALGHGSPIIERMKESASFARDDPDRSIAAYARTAFFY